MRSHIVIDGNAFYEIDDECVERKRAEELKQKRDQMRGQERAEQRKKESEKKGNANSGRMTMR